MGPRLPSRHPARCSLIFSSDSPGGGSGGVAESEGKIHRGARGARGEGPPRIVRKAGQANGAGRGRGKEDARAAPRRTRALGKRGRPPEMVQRVLARGRRAQPGRALVHRVLAVRLRARTGRGRRGRCRAGPGRARASGCRGRRPEMVHRVLARRCRAEMVHRVLARRCRAHPARSLVRITAYGIGSWAFALSVRLARHVAAKVRGRRRSGLHRRVRSDRATL